MLERVKAKRAQPLTHPDGKPFYVQIDGKNVGDKDSMFFRTKREAQDFGIKFVRLLGDTILT